MDQTKELYSWLDQYSDSHQNPANIFIHKICVPTIALTVLAFLCSIPVPQVFKKKTFSLAPPTFPSLVLSPVFAFYFLLSIKMALTMFFIVYVSLWIFDQLKQRRFSLFRWALAVFVVAWIGQFIGHSIEGKKPSFFEDLKFLAVGPLWTLASAYRALGISY